MLTTLLNSLPAVSAVVHTLDERPRVDLALGRRRMGLALPRLTLTLRPFVLAFTSERGFAFRALDN